MNEHEPKPLRDVDERVADHVDGRLSARERDRFAAELRVNPQLRQDLADYERTVAAARQALTAPSAMGSIADRVLAAVAAEEAAAAAPQPKNGGFRFGWWSLASAAALLLLTLFIDRWSARPVAESATELAAENQPAENQPAENEQSLAAGAADSAADLADAKRESPIEKDGRKLEDLLVGASEADDAKSSANGEQPMRLGSVGSQRELPTAPIVVAPITPTPKPAEAAEPPAAAQPAPSLDRERSRRAGVPVPGAPATAPTPAPSATVGSEAGAVAEPAAKESSREQPLGEVAKGEAPPGARASGQPATGASEGEGTNPGASEVIERNFERNFGAAPLAGAGGVLEAAPPMQSLPMLVIEGPVGPAVAANETRDEATLEKASGRTSRDSKDKAAAAAQLIDRIDSFLGAAVAATGRPTMPLVLTTPNGQLVVSPLFVDGALSVGGGQAGAGDAAGSDGAKPAAPANRAEGEIAPIAEPLWLVEGPKADVDVLLGRVGMFAQLTQRRRQLGEIELPIPAAANAPLDRPAGSGPAASSPSSAGPAGAATGGPSGPATTGAGRGVTPPESKRLVLRFRLFPR
jgi:hypothetical protein